MEKIEEVLAKSDILHDTKARRRLNTASNTVANITLEEIEKGVTIERLESINVPVYMYGGQVTIHGVMPDMPRTSLRVAGYKSVFLNQNGSLGVRYVAIDGEKKALFIKLRNLSPIEDRWLVAIDSSGMEAYKIFSTAEAAKQCFVTAPNDFIGSKYAFRSVFGRYFVVLNIGAIYWKDFWKLAGDLIGIYSMEQYEELKVIKTRKEEEENRARNAEREDEERLAKIKLDEMIETLSSLYSKAPMNMPGIYVRPEIWKDIELSCWKFASVIMKNGKLYRAYTKSNSPTNIPDFPESEYKLLKPEYQQKEWWVIKREIPTPKREYVAPPVLAGDITYRLNNERNGVEIYFKSMPSRAILDILKTNHFRWHPRGKFWYNTQTEKNIALAEQLTTGE